MNSWKTCITMRVLTQQNCIMLMTVTICHGIFLDIKFQQHLFSNAFTDFSFKEFLVRFLLSYVRLHLYFLFICLSIFINSMLLSLEIYSVWGNIYLKQTVNEKKKILNDKYTILQKRSTILVSPNTQRRQPKF